MSDSPAPWRRAALSAAVACAVASLSAPAIADGSAAPSPPAALSWTRAPGAEECPAGPEIAAEVERVLGGARLVPLPAADLAIEGRVARGGDGFETTLTLTLRSGAVLGSRTLTSTGGACAGVTREVGLVIALMIDPDAGTRPPAPPTPTDAPPTPPAKEVPCSPPPLPPPTIPAPERPWRFHLSVGPALAAGLLPQAAVGVRARGVVTPPRLFPLEIGGELFAPARAERDGQGVDLLLAQGFVRACPLFGASPAWGFAACGGFDLGSVRASGFGFDVNRSPELLVAAAAVAGRVDLHVAGAVTLGLGADLAIPFFRGRFYADAPSGAAREVFSTAPVAGTLDLALGVALP